MLAQSQPSKPTLNPALKDFWAVPARNRILFGGRASSKSWDAAGFAIFLASNYKVRFLCTRQFQNKIEESVYTLLKIQIERFGLSRQFVIQNNRITHKVTGSEFIFYGLWRHIDEIKSLEDVDVCWIEEAHNLTKDQWDVLEPTVRKQGSQFWIIFNPKLVTDFIYQRFVVNTPDDTVKRKINYDENPFLSQTILDVIERIEREDADEYAHIYLGEPRDDDDQSIIKRSWIRAAIDAHKKLGVEITGSKRIGFDVADDGGDKNADAYVHGFVLLELNEWKGREDELLKSAKMVWSSAREKGASITYDSIGIGAFAGGHFKELNEKNKVQVSYRRFNAGGEVVNKEDNINDDDPKSPMNKDYYSNIKAQVWWDVANRFRETYNMVEKGHTVTDKLLSLSSDCDGLDKLIDELAIPRCDFDLKGRVKVESKKDLVKRNVKSPNLAEAYVMNFAPQASSKPRLQFYVPS